MGQLEDLTGRRFGRLVVIEKAERSGGKTVWRCKCDCGEYRNVRRPYLIKGEQVSCGCYKNELVVARNKKRKGTKTTTLTMKDYAKKYRQNNLEACRKTTREIAAQKRKEPVDISNMTEEQKGNFWSKVEKSDGCWEWTGAKSDPGYGTFNVGYHNVRAHRLSYELLIGEIEQGMFICHKCDNPSCVNPEHLFMGTPGDNMRDMVNKGRNPDIFGRNNPVAKLTEQEVKEIYIDPRINKEIAEDYSISNGYASMIRKGKVWHETTKDLPTPPCRKTGTRPKNATLESLST